MKHGITKSFSAVAALTFGLMCGNIYAADAPSSATDGVSAQKTTVDGSTFLESNKKKPGVVTLPSGLQYKVIHAGNGEKPAATDVVVVNYAGRLIDGTEFDSSYKRGEPASFPVNAVIPGWTEALQLMKTGSTWELYIPSNLAYGEQGAPPSIGPNQTLIFKVNLMAVKKS